MNPPKFQIGQQVKFVNDHDRMTGKVLSYSYHSENTSDNHSGWVYKVSSKFYNQEINDMVEGYKMCREEELVDMTSYTGPTTPVKPDKVVNVSDQVNTQPATPSDTAQQEQTNQV